MRFYWIDKDNIGFIMWWEFINFEFIWILKKCSKVKWDYKICYFKDVEWLIN